MFLRAPSTSREYHSEGSGTFASDDDASYQPILKTGKGKEKKLDRNVRWSKTYQTYEERRPHSFDSDYRDDNNTFDDGDESLIADYLINKSDTNNSDEEKSPGRKKKIKVVRPSSVFTPIEIPAEFRLENRLQPTDSGSLATLSEDDMSLIDTMDSSYIPVSRVASDDASIVSLKTSRDDSKQREVDANLGHLGLVIPTLMGFWTGFSQSEETSAYGDNMASKSGSYLHSSSYMSNTSAGNNDVDKPAEGDKTAKYLAPKESGESESDTEPDSTADSHSHFSKKEGRSAFELDAAMNKGEIASTDSWGQESEHSQGTVSMCDSMCEDKIETLRSDEDSSNLSQTMSGEVVSLASMEKKKRSKFNFRKKHQRKNQDNSAGGKNKKGTKKSSTGNKQVPDEKAQPQQDRLSENEAGDLVDISHSAENEEENLNEDTERAMVVDATLESSSISTDESNEAKKNEPVPNSKEKSKKKKKGSLMNKLSFRRKGTKSSAALSKKEMKQMLEFAAVQQQKTSKEPEEKVKEVRLEELIGEAVRREQELVSSMGQNVSSEDEIKDNKELDEPEEIKIQDTCNEEEASLPKTSTKEEKPEEKVIIDLPTRSLRDHLYNDLLRGGSFDSVSTTEDILNELQQIEDTAQKMYQSMVMENE